MERVSPIGSQRAGTGLPWDLANPSMGPYNVWGEGGGKEGRSLAPSTHPHADRQWSLEGAALGPGWAGSAPHPPAPLLLQPLPPQLLISRAAQLRKPQPTSASPQAPTALPWGSRPRASAPKLASKGPSRPHPPLMGSYLLFPTQPLSAPLVREPGRTRGPLTKVEVSCLWGLLHRCKWPGHLPGVGLGAVPLGCVLPPSQGTWASPRPSHFPALRCPWKTTTRALTRILILAVGVTAAWLRADHVAGHTRSALVQPPLPDTVWDLGPPRLLRHTEEETGQCGVARLTPGPCIPPSVRAQEARRGHEDKGDAQGPAPASQTLLST